MQVQDFNTLSRHYLEIMQVQDNYHCKSVQELEYVKIWSPHLINFIGICMEVVSELFSFSGMESYFIIFSWTK